MKIVIKHRYTSAALFEHEVTDEQQSSGIAMRVAQSIYADPKAPHQELTAAQRAILEAVPVLNADSVRAYAARKWPQAMHSPLAQAMHGASAMTMLEASDADAVALRGEAMAHAQACLAACDGWTVETLGHNIESAFGMDLGADECDEIARAAIANATGEGE